MSLSNDLWQAVKAHIPSRSHRAVATDIVQLCEDAGEGDTAYGPGSVYAAAGLDDINETDDSEDELL